jgi:glutathione S-transferase
VKLYCHPLSTTSRPVLLFAAEHDLALELRPIDLSKGEQLQPAFAAVNPSLQVPVLDDGGFVLCESSAILKYLADKTGSPAYPTEPRARARVHERMDWFNTQLSRELCHGLVYPQLLPHCKRPDAAAQAGCIAWGREKALHWLAILDEHLIGPRRSYLCGERISLADYLGVEMLVLGESIGLDYARWRNVDRWLAAMKSRPHWARVHTDCETLQPRPPADGEFVRW